jgi:SOS-response transcriptional repressor LexA
MIRTEYANGCTNVNALSCLPFNNFGSTKPNMELGERLKAARKNAKIGQEKLAELSGVSQQTISKIERGKVEASGFVVHLASACGVRPEWLAMGEGTMCADIQKNTESGPDIRGRVPLVSWVQAGKWGEIIDNFSAGDAEKWLPCPVNHSSGTFVLRVRGESMFNPNGRPSFQDGDLIFVDPNRQAEHGSLVVVRLEDDKEATFKRLVIEGKNQYLRPLNPAWPEQVVQINGNATICGVVIFKGEEL